jgi:ATP adenylyltransferase
MSEAWDRLWTPHRMTYLKGEGRPTHADAGEDCPFCHAPSVDDAESLIVARGTWVFAIMNLYPYNSGHMLICTYRHVADYTDLTPEETRELAEFTKRSMQTLREVSGAHGFNIGMNQGSLAGAGIAAHLHQHVVPRWGGDTNFLPVIGGTKTMPQLLEESRALIAQAWG